MHISDQCTFRINRFPKQNRKHNSNFIDNYDKFFEMFQVDTLKLNIACLEEENKLLKNDINVFKNTLKHH